MASLYNRNSSNIWWVRFQLNGKRVQRSTGTSKKAQALRLLARLMEEERQRQEQGFLKVRFGVLCDEYCSQHLPLLKAGTRVGYLGHIRLLRTHFGEDRYIDEVRKVHVAEFVARLKKTGLELPTIRRYLATLSSLFSFAERSGWLLQNPVAAFDKRSLPEALPRTRFLSQAEYRRLVASSDPASQTHDRDGGRDRHEVGGTAWPTVGSGSHRAARGSVGGDEVQPAKGGSLVR